MRSRIAALALTLAGATWVAGAGCGDSGGGGTAGHGGKGGSGGSGGKAGGTAGSAGSSAGTSGGTGGGTAGTADGGAGTGSMAGADGGTDGPVNPIEMVTIPAALAVPTGATLKVQVHATGAQIYTCTATAVATDGGADAGDGGADAGTTYSWVLKAPDAKLIDTSNKQVGTHFAGPTWLWSADQSAVAGARVASVDSTMTDAIPWLLLKASAHMGAGYFADVTYVQRVNTRKGKAPATGCDSTKVGSDTAVDYTADYYFYTGGATALNPEWPFAAATIPSGIATPAGTTLKLKLHGWGDQIYTCTPSAGADAGADAGATTYSWVLKAPAATLYDDTNTKKGTHSAGPTWTSTDTSSIVGARQAGVDSPASDAIQWLLLKVSSHAGGTGVFTDVTYVQRVNTAQGKAPATGCDAAHANTDTSVHYSADYYYYTGDTAADGGADGG